MSKQIESYLRALKHQLWLRGVFDPDSLAEAESHLLEAAEAGMRRGLSVDESERQAVERFGSVKVVSLAFEKEGNNLELHPVDETEKRRSPVANETDT